MSKFDDQVILVILDEVSVVRRPPHTVLPVSYTHLRAHETSLHLVCRLLLEKKKEVLVSRISGSGDGVLGP